MPIGMELLHSDDGRNAVVRFAASSRFSNECLCRLFPVGEEQLSDFADFIQLDEWLRLFGFPSCQEGGNSLASAIEFVGESGAWQI